MMQVAFPSALADSAHPLGSLVSCCELGETEFSPLSISSYFCDFRSTARGGQQCPVNFPALNSAGSKLLSMHCNCSPCAYLTAKRLHLLTP